MSVSRLIFVFQGFSLRRHAGGERERAEHCQPPVYSRLVHCQHCRRGSQPSRSHAIYPQGAWISSVVIASIRYSLKVEERMTAKLERTRIYLRLLSLVSGNGMNARKTAVSLKPQTPLAYRKHVSHFPASCNTCPQSVSTLFYRSWSVAGVCRVPSHAKLLTLLYPNASGAGVCRELFYIDTNRQWFHLVFLSFAEFASLRPVLRMVLAPAWFYLRPQKLEGGWQPSHTRPAYHGYRAPQGKVWQTEAER